VCVVVGRKAKGVARMIMCLMDDPVEGRKEGRDAAKLRFVIVTST